MEIRHPDQSQQPQQPLISTLPPMSSLMSAQQSVAQGPKKDCVRLRGLPFEAQVGLRPCSFWRGLRA